MSKIIEAGQPAEVVGAVFKQSEIQNSVGFGINSAMMQEAESIIKAGNIRDEQAKVKCAAMINKISVRMKEINTLKKGFVKILEEAIDKIEAPFKTAYNTLSTLKTKLDALIIEGINYMDEQERKRIAEQLEKERIQKAVEKQKEQDADLLAPEISEPIATPAPIKASDIQIKSAPIRTEGSGTLSIRKIWRVRIVDSKLVPDAYKIPSEKLLLDARLANQNRIPGVLFFEESIPVSRS